MENKQAGEVALTWADEFIISLLADAERQQDVIKDISTEAIRATWDKLDTVSEEFLVGLEILTNRAEAGTSAVLVEVADDVDYAAFEVARHTSQARAEADDETDEEVFVTTRATSAVLIEINADIDRLADEVRESNESLYQRIDRWLSDFADEVHSTLWGWIPELTNDAAIYLASLPAMLLFESFKNFFFEETE